MKTLLSKSEKSQLDGSIDKLMHYLAVYVKRDTAVRVDIEPGHVYERVFKAPRQITISPTLYTRIDDCHGAGRCCQVPFDLIFTDYDRQRILDYNHQQAIGQFGKISALGFAKYRDKLLDSLTQLEIIFNQGNHYTLSHLWVQTNTVINQMSGNKSCPYLLMSDDRYLCGVHPFKPLHCQMPHMTVRITNTRDGSRPSISIGRMQYGRNYKFGCPVLFTQVEDDSDCLFGNVTDASYFKSQFQDDIDKLEGISKSAESLGFSSNRNFAVGIHKQLKAQETTIRHALSAGNPQPITLWRS